MHGNGGRQNVCYISPAEFPFGVFHEFIYVEKYYCSTVHKTASVV